METAKGVSALYIYGFINECKRLFRKFSKEEREYKGLPNYCRSCELLGLCRRPKEQGWKCYHGCLIINQEKSEKEKKQ